MNIIDLHAETWAALQAQRARMAHAILLTGPEGIGKLALAQAFVAGLLCERPDAQHRACEQCAPCNWLAQGNHPDFRLLRPDALEAKEEGADDDKKRSGREITIDQVRSLDDFLHVGTHRAGLRVVLIHPAEAMNRNTANALLKTLEEPAAGSLFMLVSNNAARLLPTIRSRCRTMPVTTPAADRALAWLQAHGVKTPERWLARTGGAPLRARQTASPEMAAWLDEVTAILSAGGGLSVLDAAARAEKLVKGGSGGKDLRGLVDWVQRWCVDLALLSYDQPPRYFPDLAGAMAPLAKKVDRQKLFKFNRKSAEFKSLSEHTLNTRLFIEDFFFELLGIYR